MIEIELFCPLPGQYLPLNYPFYPHTIPSDFSRSILPGIDILSPESLPKNWVSSLFIHLRGIIPASDRITLLSLNLFLLFKLLYTKILKLSVLKFDSKIVGNLVAMRVKLSI